MFDYTVVINFNSQNLSNFYDCLGSLLCGETSPSRIITGFNPYTKVYDPVLETVEYRIVDVVKMGLATPLNAFRKFALASITTKYTIFLEDDTVLVDENYLAKLDLAHQTHPCVRMSDKYSAFSINSDIMRNVVDDGYIGEGYEDLDLHRVLKQNSVGTTVMEPYLFRHKRLDLRPTDGALSINAAYFAQKHRVDFHSMKPFSFSAYNEIMFA